MVTQLPPVTFAHVSKPQPRFGDGFTVARVVVGLALIGAGAVGGFQKTDVQKAGDSFTHQVENLPAGQDASAEQLIKATDELDQAIAENSQPASGMLTSPLRDDTLAKAFNSGLLTKEKVQEYVKQAQYLTTDHDSNVQKLYNNMFDDLIKPQIKDPAKQAEAKQQADAFFEKWHHDNGFKLNGNSLFLVFAILGAIIAFGDTLGLEWLAILGDDHW